MRDIFNFISDISHMAHIFGEHWCMYACMHACTHQGAHACMYMYTTLKYTGVHISFGVIYICVLYFQRRMLENKLEEGQVFVEFEQIPRKAPTDTSETAARPENKERNRFKDVYPYDKNRVKLNPTKKNPSGYINASHIKVSGFVSL